MLSADESALPSVVVVVLNWNLPTETANCVASLLAGDYPRQRILVVDNGSSDDSAARLRARFGVQLEIVETGANLYFAGGMNVGLRWALEAGAEWVLLMNNDTFVAPDMVSRLVRTALEHPDAGIVTPMIYLAHDSTRIWTLGSRRERWWPFPRDVGRGELDRGQYAQPFPIDYAQACCMLVSREVLVRVGLLDERYRMYYEDADFSARAHRAGFEILVEPRARMWHLVSASANREAATTRYQRTRYRVRFYRQHTHGGLAWLTHLLLCAQEMGRMGLALMRGRADLARATWCGLRDGYREPRLA